MSASKYGSYDSSMPKLPDLPPEPNSSPLDLLRVPCKVKTVTVKGNKRTKQALIEAQLAKALQAGTYEELALELDSVNDNLQSLDMFKKTVCEIDVAADGSSDEVTIGIEVEEKGTHTLSSGAYMQGGEGNFEFSWTGRNFTGNAERIQGNVSLGHKISNSFRLEASKPVTHGSTSRHGISIFQSVLNLTKYSSYSETQRGVSLSREATDTQGGVHEFGYDAVWRTLQFTPKTALPPSGEASDHFKSSLRHLYTVDTRDHRVLPSEGLLFRNTLELAGLLGDCKFFKHQMEGQVHVPLTEGISLSLSGGLGYLQPLAGDVSRVSDRFFLGGPILMRGFRTKGLGPRGSGSDARALARGGDLFYTASADLPFPLPSSLLQMYGMKGHFFLNLGNNVAVRPKKGGKSGHVLREMPELLAKSRAVVGCGLVLPTAVGRVELNYCWPLRVFKELGDRTARWQVGVAFDA